MLLNLREYHRPAGDAGPAGPEAGRDPTPALDRVLALLARPDVRTVPLAGGDALLGSGDDAVAAVVDLQGLGLDDVSLANGTWQAGATVTRSRLAEDPAARALFGGVIAQAAAHWSGSVQRNRATLGGALAIGAGNDALVAALLACDAQVALYAREGGQQLPLAHFLARRRALLDAPSLILGVEVRAPADPAGAALAAVARTPADAPIVLAVACLTRAGDRCVSARLVVGGVADRPLRLPQVEAALAGRQPAVDGFAEAGKAAGAAVDPAGDYRGSAEYRRAMAGVLTQRALRAAWAMARAA